MWNYVIPHFNQFLSDLQLEPKHRTDAEGKAERIAKSLFAKYYPNQLVFDPNCYLVVGSYGKGNATQPCTDLDMFFVLPDEVCGRISRLQGNRQSQLLQEVKSALSITFPRTDLSADGQIVLCPFETYSVEVVPVLRLNEPGLFLTPHTGDGGSWRTSNPYAEYQHLRAADQLTNMKATHLTMMAKAWKRQCSVELKSVSLEVLASNFVSQWQHKEQTVFYYDWMIRDFFAFLFPYINGRTRIIGTEEWIELGDSWQTKLQTAYNCALKACEYEKQDDGLNAALEWQKIFGNQLSASAHYISLFAKMQAV